MIPGHVERQLMDFDPAEEYWSNMQAWNSSWKHQHFPNWFMKLLKPHQVQSGAWNKGYSRATNAWHYVGTHIFDHHGSVKLDGLKSRAMIAQPYGDLRNEGLSFAKKHGMSHYSSLRSPYSKGACFLVFFDPLDPGLI